jgi:hypothetical protein
LEEGQAPFAMFVDLQNKYDWVLQPVIVYPSVDRLVEALENKIVEPPRQNSMNFWRGGPSNFAWKTSKRRSVPVGLTH